MGTLFYSLAYTRYFVSFYTCIYFFLSSHSYQFRTDSHVALKIVKAANRYTDSALEEIKLLECVKKTNPDSKGWQHVAQLLNHFWHQGPNGKHACMTFEVLGESLLSLMKRYNYKGIPQHIVKRIAKQVLEGLDYLHRECGIVHTDLKPENVLVWIPNIEDYLKTDTAEILKEINNIPVIERRRSSTASWKDGIADVENISKSKKKRLKRKMKKKNEAEASQTIEDELSDQLGNLKINNNTQWNTPQVIPSSTLDITTIGSEKELDNIVVKIADLGNACWMDGEYTHVIQTRQYRSPEVIVGAKWTNEADMWSVACMVSKRGKEKKSL